MLIYTCECGCRALGDCTGLPSAPGLTIQMASFPNPCRHTPSRASGSYFQARLPKLGGGRGPSKGHPSFWAALWWGGCRVPEGCEGVGPCSLCTRCRLGWALGEKLPLASRPLQKLPLRPGMPFLLSQHHHHPLLAQGSQVPCMGVPVCGGQPGMGRYSVGRSVSQCMKATSAGLEQGPGGPESLHRPTREPEAGRGRGLRMVPARISPSGEAPLQSAYTQLFLFTANPLQKVWPSVLPRSASGCQPPAGHTHSLWTPIS